LLIPDTMTNWIKRNHGHLSFDKIEKAIGIPQGTLSKVAKGQRPLPKKWVEPLREYKDRMGW